MIAFLLRKMWKNKWMMLSLFVGNILLVGIVSSTPLYRQATMQRILQKDMQNVRIEKNTHPTIAELSYTFNYVKEERILDIYRQTRDVIIGEVLDTIDIPLSNIVQNIVIENWYCHPTEPREERVRPRAINVNSYDGYRDHLKIVQGRFPSDSLVDGNVIEAIACQNTMIRQDFLLNELLTVTSVTSNDMNKTNDSDPDYVYYIKIVGIYETLDDNDLYWTANPNNFRNDILVSEHLTGGHFIEQYHPKYNIKSRWIIMLDYTRMKAVEVARYQAADEIIKTRFNERSDHIWSYKENFMNTLDGYALRTEKLTVTLWVLQVPIYVMLAFYIYMVSRQILSLEQNDISVLKSRGASRRQIFSIYLFQSVFVGAASILIGIPLGMMICRMLGSSNGFLEMVQRSALQVELNLDAFLYSGIAAGASFLMMLVPVVRFSRVTIVDYKRTKSGKPKKALWQRFYLDVLCFGVACYGFYTYNNQRDSLARYTEVQSVDPLLYLSSSLFIIGMGLLCLRVFPYLVRLVFIVGKRFWSPSLYVSLLKVIRSAGEEQFIMIFLMFTLAVGIFSAKSARTINLNNDHTIMYQTGADLVFAER